MRHTDDASSPRIVSQRDRSNTGSGYRPQCRRRRSGGDADGVAGAAHRACPGPAGPVHGVPVADQGGRFVAVRRVRRGVGRSACGQRRPAGAAPVSYAWGASGANRCATWRDRSDSVMLLRWWRARITGYLHLHGPGRCGDRTDSAQARPHLHNRSQKMRDGRDWMSVTVEKFRGDPFAPVSAQIALHGSTFTERREDEPSPVGVRRGGCAGLSPPGLEQSSPHGGTTNRNRSLSAWPPDCR